MVVCDACKKKISLTEGHAIKEQYSLGGRIETVCGDCLASINAKFREITATYFDMAEEAKLQVMRRLVKGKEEQEHGQ